jgi:oxygen-independent coproporphyrinogen-3 oxidase
MSPTSAQLRHASRNLPRYTSYPTALKFQPAESDAWLRRRLAQPRPGEPISLYVHTPFCTRLCWYCGCHTSVVHDYDRVAPFVERLLSEIDLLASACAPGGAAAHAHFGGGSPNALSPRDFARVVERLRRRFGFRPGAEIAVELDPGTLSEPFIDALGEASVTRVSLGVQTFDAGVQAKVNRIQPFEAVERAVARLRAAGIDAINFDLMYGLPGQTPEIVEDSVRLALSLRPDRAAVFGYAHVPWMKKHQVMIRDCELADAAGRWLQADAADEALVASGYIPIGLDHYARLGDPLAAAAAEGRLHRNFQGYTDDQAGALLPLGPSSIGSLSEAHVQNAVPLDVWGRAIDEGRLPVAKQLALTADDRLRAAVIERLMCDLEADVGAICSARGFAMDALDGELHDAAALQSDGLCTVEGRRVRVMPASRRLVRAVAACFDAGLPATVRHALAV